MIDLSKHIHIVSFDVPLPADYGGVIDVFYKIKALSELGVKVHLHCFDYGRGKADQLDAYCESVTYYRRDMRKHLLLKANPFIVESRANKELLANLKRDNLPVFLEGLHTCWFLKELDVDSRKVVVRAHNIEHDYYAGLALSEKQLLKRKYFSQESRKLELFEKELAAASRVLALTEADMEHFKTLNPNTSYIPVFHGAEFGNVAAPKDYCLYHGNLSVPENIAVALQLIGDDCWTEDRKLLLAGKDPSQEVIDAVDKCEVVALIANPNHDELNQLIAEARINIVFTHQRSGLKLKLVHALFMGGTCLVNRDALHGVSLDETCAVIESGVGLGEKLDQIWDLPFGEEQLSKRKAAMSQFDNAINAQKIIDLIWD